MKKYNGEYIRENWLEWFVVRITEGEQPPKLYLPVNREYASRSRIYWIFYLAPFVLIFLIVKNSMWSVWKDLVYILEDLLTNNKE